MTPQDTGRRGGQASGRRRMFNARLDARARGLEALPLADPCCRGYLEGWLQLGLLDGWLVRLERQSYRRGYAVRDEADRRRAAKLASRRAA